MVSPSVVKSGVRQGSLLGPTLFLIYINDMPRIIKHYELVMFADDLQCIKTFKSNNGFLDVQHDLNSLQNWFTDNEIFSNYPLCQPQENNKKTKLQKVI